MKHIPLPLAINYEALAKGFLGLFDEDERTVLRFGMLPAKKMEVLERELKEKILGQDSVQPNGSSKDFIWISTDHQRADGYEDVIEFNIDRVVSDIAHNVSLELYKIGDLVV